MTFQLLNHLVEYVRRLGDISVLDSSVPEEFNAHTNMSYRGLSRGRATRIQESITLMKWQQKRERSIISAEIGRTSRSVEHKKECRCMEEGGAEVQPICIGC